MVFKPAFFRYVRFKIVSCFGGVRGEEFVLGIHDDWSTYLPQTHPPPRDRASPRAYRPAVSINKALYSTIVSEGSTLEGGRLTRN